MTQSATRKEYKSRASALKRFFEQSRDRWKNKYMGLKATVKGYKNRIADLIKSRDQWRLKAEQAGERISALEAQNASLTAQLAGLEEKKGSDVGPMSLTSVELCVPCGQQYPVFVVQRFVSLVIDCGASFRCAANVLERFQTTGEDERVPDWSTGRLWLLRIGLAALLSPLVIADDWVWVVDHSIQIGTSKCLVILGMRVSDFPVGRPLCHEDMEPIALVPMSNSTKVTVAEQLEEAVKRTGVPRAILSDRGSDLHGGVEIFRQSHPETIELQDIKHKAACLLKARLEGDELWNRYASQAAQTKCALQQTELAFLAPPSQRSKARFMNLSELVEWGSKTLALVDDPSRLAKLGVTADRVREKLGWLREYREALRVWSAWHDLIKQTWEFVRRHGYYLGAGLKLAAALPEASGSVGELREQLISFVRSESAKANLGERLPGSTEVLESCFGKLKALERDQSKSGFTGLVLSVGAMVSQRSAEWIRQGLEKCRVRDVWDWCKEKLGQSVQSKRKQAYSKPAGATKPG
jgi:hypothetical protein